MGAADLLDAMHIRVAREEDRTDVNRVVRRASLAVETGDVLRLLLESSEHLEIDEALLARGQVFLAEVAGVVVGVASFSTSGSSYAELEGLFVDPDYWRRGIATLLLAEIEAELLARQAAGIRVVAGDSAVPFYRSMGFSITGEEQTPLGPVVPVMAKELPSPDVSW